ncbi:MAG: pantetheine-phosphate adenylyltransferase [Caldisericia bacterium]
MLYPSTFDPPTLGHISLIKRAAKLYEKVVVAVAESAGKDTLFTPDQRMEILNQIFKDNESVEIVKFDTLLVLLARNLGIKTIIRGLRTVSDFEYEYKMAITNSLVNKDLETVFLMSEPEFCFISSTLVKQVARGGGDISPFVPSEVVELFEKG